MREKTPTRAPEVRRSALAVGGALALALALNACATARSGHKYAYSQEELLSESTRRAPHVDLARLILPFDAGPELEAEVIHYARFARGDYEQALALLDAITDSRKLGIRFDVGATGSMEDTLSSGRGNCLSIATLYVGMARALGLNAYFVDASERMDELRQEEDLIVSAGHISAEVSTERGPVYLDFAGELRRVRLLQRIDDFEALAHHYNNRGYEVINEAQVEDRPVPWEEAQRDFELALLVSPGFAPAINNLGLVSARTGDLETAEQYYRAAIQADPHFSSPYTNLAGLQLRQGELAESLESFARAAELDRRNPYLHYHWGVALTRSGAMEQATDVLERALKLKKDYEPARELLDELRVAP